MFRLRANEIQGSNIRGWMSIQVCIQKKFFLKRKYSSYTSYPFKTDMAWRHGVCNHTKSTHIQYVQVSGQERRLLDRFHGKCSDTDKLRENLWAAHHDVTLKVRGYGSVVCRGTLATGGLDPEGSQRGARLSWCLPRILIKHTVPNQSTTV